MNNNIKDYLLRGAFVDKWNCTSVRVKELDNIIEDQMFKLNDLCKELKVIRERIETLFIKLDQTKKNIEKPSVVNSIAVDLGVEYNCYLTNLFTVYQETNVDPTEPIFFKDSNGEQVLLEWHEFVDFFKEYCFTIFES